MELGKRLDEFLKIKNLTVYKLSKITGIGLTTINDLIKGKIKDTTTEKALKIAKALDISLTELVGESEEIFRMLPEKDKRSIIKSNLSLVMNKKSPREFVEFIDNPNITEEMINDYLNGEIIPGMGSLIMISEAIGIDYSFFFSMNTVKTLEQAKKTYQEEIELKYVNDGPYEKLIKKIKDNDLDLNIVDNMLDLLIAQKAKNK